jgi:transcriptional regulator with XRE-family HTH domain
MDWKNIIHELQESGMTQQEIADACNTGQSHISSLANGKRHEPRYSLGDRLRKLHAQRCKAGAADRRSGTDRRSGGDRRKADRRAEAA